jgi:hypothetical protein
MLTAKLDQLTHADLRKRSDGRVGTLQTILILIPPSKNQLPRLSLHKFRLIHPFDLEGESRSMC